ncbi:MAG: PAS domain S-box protein [Candidatus Aminicenantes bacterium]|nr:PAS domain S-box protein [Candidatus Aminicenantes bacterium]
MATRKGETDNKFASKLVYQNTIDAIDSLIHMVDTELKITLVNQKFYQWNRQLGLEYKNVIGKDLFDIFSFLSKKVRQEYQQVLKTGEAMVTEEVTEINNQKIRTETKKIPIIEADRVSGIVTLVTDITSQKAYEGELSSREDKFRLLFEQSNDALFLLNPDGIIIDCNQKTSDLLGFPKNKIIGKNYKIFVVDKYHEDSEEKFLQLKKGLKPLSYEKEFVGQGGKIIPVEINPTSVLDRNKKLKWIYSVVRDITEKKRNEQLQRSIFEISEKTFTSKDLNQLYQAIHQILGQHINVKNFYISLYDPKQELLSFPYFVDEHDSTPAPKKPGKGLTEYVLRTEEPLLLTQELSRELEKKNQIELIGTDCLSWLGIPLKTSTGKIFGVLVVQSYDKNVVYTQREKDILMFVSQQIATAIERKKTEKTLRETEIQFHHLQKIESIGTLVGAIAHDYNNVLTSILGNAQLLEYMIPQENIDLKKYSTAIIKASENAAGLVQQLLAFTREEDQFLEIINLNKIINDWLELLVQIVGDQVSINLDLTPDIFSIHGNPEKIRQVIMNLVINSRDAMPQGGTLSIETSNIEVKISKYIKNIHIKAGSYIKLVIKDNGIGIDEKFIDDIFKPFYSMKLQGKGTGLGLSIVKRIIDEMNAHIMVDSKTRQGTTVSIYFPSYEAQGKKPPIKKGMPVIQGLGEVILLVEDDDEVRQMFKNLLEGHLGYLALTATNGREALEILDKNRVSLVITDLKMPDMDGITLLKQIKKNHPYLKKKVIAITAFSENQESYLTELGFSEVIKKPIKVEGFSATISKILGSQ